MKTVSADQMAARILLNPRLSEGDRQSQLTSLFEKVSDAVNNRVECPECGSKGPHDDNGVRGSNLTYCCKDCGNQFDAEEP